MNGAWAEADLVPSSLEQHHGADRVGQRHAREEGADVVVVPDPGALEVGELELALVDLPEQLGQEGFLRIERGGR